jgi:L-aminopeptidase/D-esterase-like protein
VTKGTVEPLASTTLAVVATDIALTRNEAQRLAIAAHDGLALAIYPAHTPFDGDTVFALSTGAQKLQNGPRGLLSLCAAASTTLARAVARAVYAATPSPGDKLPTWRKRHGS